MTVEEINRKKREYGYSYEQIAEKSGIPLGTVQKVLGGITKSPRFKTLQALSRIFDSELSTNDDYKPNYLFVEESAANYTSGSSALKYAVENSTAKVHTIDEYISLPEGTRVELIDGQFYDMAAPSVLHQIISMNIWRIFDEYVRTNNGACLPLLAPTDVQLDCDDKTIVQPDILIVCDRDKVNRLRIIGAPDLIVEIVFPSNWYMDVLRKLKKYKNAGVREYWLIFPDKKSVIVYNLENSSDAADFTEYSFDNIVPVSIWNGKCTVDFKDIYEKVRFLYE